MYYKMMQSGTLANESASIFTISTILIGFMHKKTVIMNQIHWSDLSRTRLSNILMESSIFLLSGLRWSRAGQHF